MGGEVVAINVFRPDRHQIRAHHPFVFHVKPSRHLRTLSQPSARHRFCLYFFHIWVYSEEDDGLSPLLPPSQAPPVFLDRLCKLAQI